MPRNGGERWGAVLGKEEGRKLDQQTGGVAQSQSLALESERSGERLGSGETRECAPPTRQN